MLERLFLSVLEISISVSFIVVIMLLFTPYFNKKYAMKWKYLIWIFLALRLVIPFDAADVGDMMRNAMVRAAQTSSEAGATEAPDTENTDGAARQRIVVEIPEQVTQPLMVQSGKAAGKITILTVIEAVWFAGMLSLLAVHIGSYLCYKRQILRSGEPVKDGYVLRRMTSLLHELHIKSKVRIVRYAKAPSPMVMGFVRPVLVLPDKEYLPEELFFILKHELVHIKRHDIYWKLLFVVANAVHWFNPLIWIMHKEAVVDMELSCDETVMRGADFADRKAYTETLLSMLHKQSGKGSALTTQFYGGKQIMKKRFRNILMKTKARNGLAIMLCAAVLTLSLGVLIGCSVSGDSSENTETDDTADGMAEGGAEGIVADGIDVPDTVLDSARTLVNEWFVTARENDAEADYRNWRIESLAHCYTYEDFQGMMLQVYQLNYEFLSGKPENIALAGGMSVSEDGWVTPDYADSSFFIFRQEDDILSFLTVLVENDCLPGDDMFDGDLEWQLEDMGFLAASEAGADTTTLTYIMEGEIEEEYATLFAGGGYSIYIPDNWSLYAPDAWSYIYNEQIQFWVTHFENQNLEQVQADMESSLGMHIDNTVSGKIEMAKQEGGMISGVRLMEAADDVWGVFYTYPEEAIEGAGARLPVIIDTFAVLGEAGDGQEWQSSMQRSSFWNLAPDMDSIGNTLRFANGLQIILPEEWADNIVMEVSYGAGAENNNDTLLVCEENNAKAGVGGVLFYMHYIDKDYYEFSAEEPYQMFGEYIDRLLGIYEWEGHEYALVFELPREMNYVEGDEEMEKAYEDMFALVDEVRIDTGEIEGFVQRSVDEVDWVAYMD